MFGFAFYVDTTSIPMGGREIRDFRSTKYSAQPVRIIANIKILISCALLYSVSISHV